jgi:rare lipoprotein A
MKQFQATNLSNKVKVRINDRGPFVEGRIIDLSKKAARRIDMLDAGVSPVEVKYR